MIPEIKADIAALKVRCEQLEGEVASLKEQLAAAAPKIDAAHVHQTPAPAPSPAAPEPAAGEADPVTTSTTAES